jgi:hypothetical protein
MSPKKRNKIVAGVALVLAVALLVLGVVQGDVFDTFQKASRICFECIGIG